MPLAAAGGGGGLPPGAIALMAVAGLTILWLVVWQLWSRNNGAAAEDDHTLTSGAAHASALAKAPVVDVLGDPTKTMVTPFGFHAGTGRVAAAALPSPRLAAAKQAADHSTTVIVPLTLRQNVYWVQLCVTSTQECAEAVFDTGSSNLVVGTKDCTSCGGGGQGRITMPSPDRIHRRNVPLHYGSQSIVAHVALDTMKLPGFHLDDSTHSAAATWQWLSGGSGTVPKPAAILDTLAMHAQPEFLERQDTEIFATHRIRGATAANVFGMAPSAPGAPPSLLSTLMRGRVNQSFGVLLGRKGGMWILGPPPPMHDDESEGGHRLVDVPLERPRHLQALPTLFFMTQLEDILVGPHLHELRSLRAAAAGGGTGMRQPWWLMLDTGSTATFTSSALRPWLTAAGVHSLQRSGTMVALVLAGGVHLVLAPDVFEDTFITHETFVEDVLGVDGMLLGCMAMRGMYIHHDAPNHRMRFASGPSLA